MCVCVIFPLGSGLAQDRGSATREGNQGSLGFHLTDGDGDGWDDEWAAKFPEIDRSDPWADANGDLGPVYGKQWRDWKKYEQSAYNPLLFTERRIDQIQEVMNLLHTDPFSRRIIVNAF